MEPKQALIIDDNPSNVSVLARLLSEEGVRSTRVTNPHQINTVLETIGDVDVIFLDLELPDINGYDILAKLKADTRFQGIPIVAYTVHLGEINTAHRKGFHSFLGKPIDSEKFPDQLARILRGEHVWETV